MVMRTRTNSPLMNERFVLVLPPHGWKYDWDKVGLCSETQQERMINQPYFNSIQLGFNAYIKSKLSWAQTPVTNWAVCLGQKVSN